MGGDNRNNWENCDAVERGPGRPVASWYFAQRSLDLSVPVFLFSPISQSVALNKMVLDPIKHDMITQSIDTHPKTEKVLIGLIRQANPARKLSQVRSLSQTMIHLSRRAIARANKNMDEQEVNLMFVAHHYGNDLADRLRKYIENRET